MSSKPSDPQPGVEEIAAFVDDSVFTQLSAKVGGAKEGNEGALEKKPLCIEEEFKDYRDAGLRVSQKQIEGFLAFAIRMVYKHPDVTAHLARNIAVKTVEGLLAKFDPEADSLITTLGEDEMSRLSNAFTNITYVGNAQDDLAEYLRDCWKDYNPTKYKAPCVAVVQSSGFGKSRTVRELALKAEREPNLNLKVMYMCARVHKSTGFPEATSKLRDWLFHEGSKVKDITRRLKAIYVYATKHWPNVQAEWLDLFVDSATDISMAEKLSKETKTITIKASDSASVSDTSIKTPSTSTVKDPNGKLVVLVIDEARSLLAEVDGKKNDFRMLRNALESANLAIGPEGGIFGVLIDTNSRISDLTPPLLLDPSSRKSGGSLASFAPLVLADTMDAHWDDYCEDGEINEGSQVAAGDEEKKEQQERAKIAMYKTVVTGSDGQAWEALRRMGRPMWYSTYPDPAHKARVIDLAANKLLLGLPPSKAAYNKDTMFGVASMLCRLGVRPHSTSALASRAPADFMAILAYVNFKREGYVSSYASDPVLALGAMKVWYELPDGLEKYILPQLKNLLLDEALDTGGVGEIGEMVARILLLLAMDKCVMGDKHFSQCYDTIEQFVPVQDFLDVLQGNEDMPIYRKGMYNAEDKRPEFNEWRSQWEGWYVGFTHFVQLQLEPNEDTLWFLLGRRAAGIFPRNQYGADLLIPMFKKRSTSKPVGEETAGDDDEKEEEHEVLMMLIQVKNRSPVDKGFFKAATEKLCPWFVFGKNTGNASGKKSTDAIDGGPDPLSFTDVRDTIRIYMNVRGRKSDGKFIYGTEMKDNLPKPPKKKSPRHSGEETANEDNTEDAAEAGEVGSNSSVSSISEDAEEKGEVGSNSSVSSILEDAEEEEEEEEEEEGPIFTICLRLLNRDTYPFLNKDVAPILSKMVESQYDPIGLVEGDLDYRDEDEKQNKDVNSYAQLSLTAKRDKLLQNARKALAYAPGQKKKTDDESDVDDTSEGVSKGDQGGETETSKKRAREDQEGEEGRPTKRAKGSNKTPKPTPRQ